MKKEYKINQILQYFPKTEVEVCDDKELFVIKIDPQTLLDVCGFLKKMLGFDYLQFLTCIDRSQELELQYHLYSYSDKDKVIIKTSTQRVKGKIQSITSVWKTADWHEREAYDLFGVSFENHPDLKRILLEEDFEGHPLLKDFIGKNVVKLPKI